MTPHGRLSPPAEAGFKAADTRIGSPQGSV